FFQAEDGIRDRNVTGVQTCALPICRFQPTYWTAYRQANERFAAAVRAVAEPGSLVWVNDFHLCLVPGLLRSGGVPVRMGLFWHRSEERRVGKEGQALGWVVRAE